MSPDAHKPRSEPSSTTGPKLWLQKRNCALTPSQLAAWFVSVSLLSLSIAMVFALFGAWVVLPFAMLEVFGFFVRSEGTRLRREEHLCPWVRVEYEGRPRSPVWLVMAGRRIAVGRFLPEHERARFALELRHALVTI